MVSSEGSISLGPWAGPVGDPWSFIASQGINQIAIYTGTNIKSIAFGDADGQTFGQFGGKDPNDEGEKAVIDINWHSEFLTSISRLYGVYKGILGVKPLSFDTNFTKYGPFGTTSISDTSFSVPMEGGAIVGFHGRGGYYLDATGIHVKPV